MKCYRDYDGGSIPELEVLREGVLTRIYFDFEVERKTVGEEEAVSLVCENIDVQGTDYASIVNAIISGKYPSDKYEAVMANYAEASDAGSEIPEAKREEYLAEYAAFQAWRRKAKAVAAAVTAEIG